MVMVLTVWLNVTPLAGVWIEILDASHECGYMKSLPLRECGLKSTPSRVCISQIGVTPLAGVWIEIPEL